MAKGNGEKVELVDNRKQKADEELRVECDFSNVSRRWVMEWSETNGAIAELGIIIDADDPLQALDDLGYTKKSLSKEITGLIRKRNALMAQVIVKIPDTWLTSDAVGVEIDWRDPDNLLDYVNGSYDDDLINGVTQARAESAKNSRRTTSTA